MRLLAGIVGAFLLAAPASAMRPADPNNYRGVWIIKGEAGEARCLATLSPDSSPGAPGWGLALADDCPKAFRIPPGLTRWHVAPVNSALVLSDAKGKPGVTFEYQPDGTFMTPKRRGGKLRLLWDKTLNPGIE